MTVHANLNLAFRPVVAADGDCFVGCNLMRAAAGTPICESVAGLTFRRCNLVNCRLPLDAVTVDCTLAAVDLCYWLYPGAGLPAEATDCRHVVRREEVEDPITGERSVNYLRENRVLGG